MKINGEEVELVTSFDQLRAGMIVWTKPCSGCGLPERAILVRPVVGHIRFDDGGLRVVDHWTRVPKGCRSTVVTRGSVEEGRVYAVVDPKLAATTARKREAVRT